MAEPDCCMNEIKDDLDDWTKMIVAALSD